MKLKSGITTIIKGCVGQVIHGDVVMSRGIHFGGNEIIQGNGKPTLDNRPVTQPFSMLHVTGAVAVEVNICDVFGVLVSGDENLAGLIETTITGGVLHVTLKQGAAFMTLQPLKVSVAMPWIESVELQGYGDIALYGLHQEKLDIELRGSGDLVAVGTVATLDLRLKGSGDIDARKLRATRATLKLHGSGDVRALVSESVKIRSRGTGDIEVYGSPDERDCKCTGTGDIRFPDNTDRAGF